MADDDRSGSRNQADTEHEQEYGWSEEETHDGQRGGQTHGGQRGGETHGGQRGHGGETTRERHDRIEQQSGSKNDFVEKRKGDTLINAVIGAVVTVVTSFVPFSPVIGGGVAGYLQDRGKRSGAVVGGISGLLAAIPAFLVFTLIFGGIGISAIAGGEGAGGLFFIVIMGVFVLMVAAIMGGLGALGGFLGGMLADREDSGTPTSRQR